MMYSYHTTAIYLSFSPTDLHVKKKNMTYSDLFILGVRLNYVNLNSVPPQIDNIAETFVHINLFYHLLIAIPITFLLLC